MTLAGIEALSGDTLWHAVATANGWTGLEHKTFRDSPGVGFLFGLPPEGAFDGRRCPLPVPRWHEHVGCAWLLLEEMRKHFSDVQLWGADGWGLTVWRIDRFGVGVGHVGPVNGDTAAEAICKTWLLWKSKEVSDGC